MGWGFLFLAPDNIVYTRMNSIYATGSLPGTPEVDVFDYAVEIKFLQGPTLRIFGKFNFIVLLILYFFFPPELLTKIKSAVTVFLLIRFRQPGPGLPLGPQQSGFIPPPSGHRLLADHIGWSLLQPFLSWMEKRKEKLGCWICKSSLVDWLCCLFLIKGWTLTPEFKSLRWRLY